MADSNASTPSALLATTPLGGYENCFGETTLSELPQCSLISMATSRQRIDALATAVQQHFGLHLPEIGQSSTGTDPALRLLGLQQDQWFLLSDDHGGDPLDAVRAPLGEQACLVDQSDSWVGLQIEGPDSRRVLARICPVDLQADSFAVGAVARTVMEHLAAIVVRTGEDGFMLLSPRSSAQSFLQAVETSLINVQ